MGPLTTTHRASCLQYMTHRNRWGRLERGVQLHNYLAATRIVALLCSMQDAAHQAAMLAAGKQADVLRRLQSYHSIDDAQVWQLGGCRALAGVLCGIPDSDPIPPFLLLAPGQAIALLAERSAAIQQHAQPDLKMPPPAEYALLRLRCIYASPQSSTVAACLPPAINVFCNASLEKLAPGKPALASLTSRLRQLTMELHAGAEPALDSQEFAAAVAALAQFEIERLQISLTRMAQQVRWAATYASVPAPRGCRPVPALPPAPVSQRPVLECLRQERIHPALCLSEHLRRGRRRPAPQRLHRAGLTRHIDASAKSSFDTHPASPYALPLYPPINCRSSSWSS